MTVYNEADFVRFALASCVDFVDDVVVVEGAYQETIKCGGEPRSTDGTIEAVKGFMETFEEMSCHNIGAYFPVHYIEANEQTDKDQRNIGLERIKQVNPDGWLLIIDGDEVYTKENFMMVRNYMKIMEKQDKYAAYFKSLTFVGDFEHYTDQEFPRLFRITPECEFTNDNFMRWPDKGVEWKLPHVIKIPYLRFHHYAFCKGVDNERFLLKKKWWETRFGDNYMGTGKSFEYDWYVNEEGKIRSPNHDIYKYTGRHPEIMKDHPLWEKGFQKKK